MLRGVCVDNSGSNNLELGVEYLLIKDGGNYYHVKNHRGYIGAFQKSRFDLLSEGDKVNNPKHYGSHPSGIECIEVTRHMNFNLGNAIKYIWRCDLKGYAIEDLKKAIFYLEDEIKLREGKV